MWLWGYMAFWRGGEYYIYPICLRELIGRMSISYVSVVSLGFFLLSFWGFLGFLFSFRVVGFIRFWCLLCAFCVLSLVS